jgi:hypothetical protein
MAETAKKPLRMTASEFIGCIALSQAHASKAEVSALAVLERDPLFRSNGTPV